MATVFGGAGDDCVPTISKQIQNIPRILSYFELTVCRLRPTQVKDCESSMKFNTVGSEYISVPN